MKRRLCCKAVQEDSPSERTGVGRVSHINSIAPQPSTGSGSVALRTASSRFRKKFLSSLPAAPSTQAHVIAAGLQTLSPTTKRAVNSKLGIMSPKSKHRLDLDSQISASLKDHLEILKTRRVSKAKGPQSQTDTAFTFSQGSHCDCEE